MGILKKFKRAIKKAVNKFIVKPIKKVFNFAVDLVGAVFSWLTPSVPDYDNPGSFEAYNQGITVNKQSNISNIPVVYGEKKIGGTRVFVGSADTDNKYLYVCLAMCEGQIESCDKIYIDDEAVPLDTLSHGTQRSPTSGRYKDRAIFQFFDGRDDQTASDLLSAHSLWGSKHRLRGVAYIAARFEWKKATQSELENQINSNPYGGIPNITAVVKGKKVLDLTTITPASYNTEYADDTLTYSRNPANLICDYMRNPRYGKATANKNINFARFKEAADICATSKTFEDGSAPYLECNTVLDTGKRMFDNVKVLLETCRGSLPYQAGKYGLSIEGAVESGDLGNLFVIDDNIIIGEISVAGEDKSLKFNTCELTFSNKDKEYDADTYIYQDTTYLAQDGGEVLKKTHTSPGITERRRAGDQARLIVDRSRDQMLVEVTCSAEAQNIQPGDVVKLTHALTENPASASDYMFQEKLFRVTGCEQNVDQTVDFTLIEHNNSIYDIATISEDEDLNAYRRGKEYVPVSNPGGGDEDNNGGADDPISGWGAGNFAYTLTTDFSGGLSITMAYTGLSTWIDRFQLKTTYPSGRTEAMSLNAYPPSNTGYVLLYKKGEFGTYTIRLEGRSQQTGQEVNLIPNTNFTYNYNNANSNAVTTSAAGNNWSGA